MATTSPDSLWSPDDVDDFDQLHADLATMQSSVQAALDKRAIKSFIWDNDAERIIQAGMVTGDQGYQKDTNQSYTYNGTSWVLNGPLYALFRKSANQSLPTGGVATSITWDVEVSDKWNMHDNVTNTTRITVPVAGLYKVDSFVYVNAASGLSVLRVLAAGSEVPGLYDRIGGTSAAGSPMSLSGMVPLSANDHIEIQAAPGIGGAIAAGGTSGLTSFVSIEYVGAI